MTKPASPMEADTSYVMRAAASMLTDVLAKCATGDARELVLNMAEELNARALLLQAVGCRDPATLYPDVIEMLREIKEIRE